MGIKKIIAVDTQYAEIMAKGPFPISEFRALQTNSGVDVLETLVTVVQKVPEDDSVQAIGDIARHVEAKRCALECRGCRVLVCPAKRNPKTRTGIKHSDDAYLMVETLLSCLRLGVDYLTLVAADGDYSPMVRGLRREGIRTEVFADPESLALDLKRAAWSHCDLMSALQECRRSKGRRQLSRR